MSTPGSDAYPSTDVPFDVDGWVNSITHFFSFSVGLTSGDSLIVAIKFCTFSIVVNFVLGIFVISYGTAVISWGLTGLTIGDAFVAINSLTS